MINTITGNTLEYTSRERLDLNDVILDDNRIKMACEHTCFINVQRIEKVEIKELSKIYSEILVICKELRIKKSYPNKFKSFLSQINKDKSYENEYKTYNEKYNQLLESCKIKAEEGIYIGWQDDIYYHDVILPLRREVDLYDRVGTLLDKVVVIKNTLIEIKDNLLEFDKYTAPDEIYL